MTQRIGSRANSAPTQDAGLRVPVAQPFPRPVLALGAELKNTVCTGLGNEAFVSESHGEITDPRAYRRFLGTVERFRARLNSANYVVAHDLHPTYVSTVYARQEQQRRVAVQHHHAHAISCAGDAGVSLPVVGVVCDGAGYGTDGAIWGGEVLLCHATSFRRMAHLDYFVLPGGDAAARSTWRPALSLLREAFPDNWRSVDVPAFESVAVRERSLVSRQLDVGVNTPSTSSLGRLFDAVAFLAGICTTNTYEGQAAIELQATASDGYGAPYSFKLLEDSEAIRIDWRPMIREIVGDVHGGVGPSAIGARFHETLAATFAAAVELTVRRTGVERVVLSGGCFMNDLLCDRMAIRLGDCGLTGTRHRRLPPGDAGLSLGQAVIASAVAADLDPAPQ